MGVGSGPGRIVLDGDLAPLPKGGIAPNFWPTPFVAKGLNGSMYHLAQR